MSDFSPLVIPRGFEMGDTKVLANLGKKNERSLIFVHGWNCDSGYWRGQEPLAERANVVLVNLRGSGTTDMGKSTPGSYLTDCAYDLRDVLLDLKLPRPTLVLHSMAGLVGLEYLRLLKAKTVSRLVPEGVDFVTPILDDPRETLPSGLKRRLSSKVARFMIDRIVAAYSRYLKIRAQIRGLDSEEPKLVTEHDIRYEILNRNVIQMLKLFSSLSPLVIRLTGGNSEHSETFKRFLVAAEKADQVGRNFGVYGMTFRGSFILESARRSIQVPSRVRLITGTDDLFVGAREAAERMQQIFGSSFETTEIRKAGHMLFQEDPARFNRIILE